MMHARPELSERELRAMEKARQKAELIGWLRREAAARDGEMAWYVARTSRRADAVAAALRRYGIDAVCPMERRWRRYPRSNRRYSVDIPLLGNYLLVRLLKAESAWVGFLTFRPQGVVCLQGNGEKPVPLRDQEAAQILESIEDAQDGPARQAARLAVGDRVVHPLGPQAELEGVVVGLDDARREAVISTVLFGREIETRCGIDDIEKL